MSAERKANSPPRQPTPAIIIIRHQRREPKRQQQHEEPEPPALGFEPRTDMLRPVVGSESIDTARIWDLAVRCAFVPHVFAVRARVVVR